MTEPNFDDGLLPAIVQDGRTGAVLMQAYMNEEAYERSRETGFVHFWSRSRQELWKKGETSGNTLALESMSTDCDGDAILIQARPAGPTCHTGQTTCFGEPAPNPLAVITELREVIDTRVEERPEDSYTTTLVEGGPEATGRKLVEEATEVLLAAKDHAAGSADDQRVAEEAADLLYHLLVTLAERGVALETVTKELAARRR